MDLPSLSLKQRLDLMRKQQEESNAYQIPIETLQASAAEAHQTSAIYNEDLGIYVQIPVGLTLESLVYNLGKLGSLALLAGSVAGYFYIPGNLKYLTFGTGLLSVMGLLESFKRQY